MHRFITTALLLVISTMLSAKEVTLVSGNGFEPFSDETLPHGGLATSIITQAYKTQGVDVEVVYKPWARSLHSAKTGEYAGTFPLIRTPEREQVFFYSEPVITTKSKFFTNKHFAHDLTDIQDLAGKKIILCNPLGWSNSKAIENMVANGELERATPKTLKDCFNMVKIGRADIVGALEESALWAIKSNNDSINYFKVFDINKKIINLHLVISKKLDNSKEQIERFNNGLNKIKSTGQYEKIKQDYFSE